MYSLSTAARCKRRRLRVVPVRQSAYVVSLQLALSLPASPTVQQSCNHRAVGLPGAVSACLTTVTWTCRLRAAKPCQVRQPAVCLPDAFSAFCGQHRPEDHVYYKRSSKTIIMTSPYLSTVKGIRMPVLRQVMKQMQTSKERHSRHPASILYDRLSFGAFYTSVVSLRANFQ